MTAHEAWGRGAGSRKGGQVGAMPTGLKEKAEVSCWAPFHRKYRRF
jgi:hypothetical protein